MVHDFECCKFSGTGLFDASGTGVLLTIVLRCWIDNFLILKVVLQQWLGHLHTVPCSNFDNRNIHRNAPSKIIHLFFLVYTISNRGILGETAHGLPKHGDVSYALVPEEWCITFRASVKFLEKDNAQLPGLKSCCDHSLTILNIDNLLILILVHEQEIYTPYSVQ